MAIMPDTAMVGLSIASNRSDWSDPLSRLHRISDPSDATDNKFRKLNGRKNQMLYTCCYDENALKPV